MKTSIVVPVYNEVDKIRKVIEDLLAINIGGHEIIFVDDGSTDGTAETLNKIMHDDIRILLHSQNHGKGAAIQSGIKHAWNDIIVFFDADLEYPASDIINVIAPLRDFKATVCYGSRFKQKGNKFLLMSYIANRFLSLLTSLIIRQKITDMETGLKAFRRHAIKSLNLKQDRFGIEPEITCKVAAKHKIVEVPISYNARSEAQGKKIRPIDGIKAIWYLLKYGGESWLTKIIAGSCL